MAKENITKRKTEKKYKIYTAVLNQIDENDPVVTVLENTFSNEFKWVRKSEGNYYFTGLVDNDLNTFVSISQPDSIIVNELPLYRIYLKNNEGILETYCSLKTPFPFRMLQKDSLLSNVLVEIKQYIL
jgi:hypothetical protein